MIKPVKKASTDQSVILRVIDSTDGTPETTVAYDTAGVDLWYRREGAVSVDITEATLATVDAAHADGGFIHINDGYCRLDLPDAACATGSNGVLVGGTFTGMIVIGCYVPLVDYDPYDTVRLGLTALPNAAADAAGGLPISDAGALDLDALNTAAVRLTAARAQVIDDWINGGRLDLLLDAIPTTAMRGTDSAALASVCTEARLAELAAENIPTDLSTITAYVDELESRLTAARAGYLDELAAANLPADIADIPTVAEFNARTLPTADYFDPAADTVALVTDITTKTGFSLSTAGADAIWDRTEGITGSAHSFEAILARLYRFILNKEVITNATGAVALRNEADSADIGSQTITDNSTLTTRTAFSWV